MMLYFDKCHLIASRSLRAISNRIALGLCPDDMPAESQTIGAVLDAMVTNSHLTRNRADATRAQTGPRTMSGMLSIAVQRWSYRP
jgi:hypothetical protein